jgi:hypothetical protein
MHITRLIKIAEKPRITIRSLRKGNETTVPGVPVTSFAACSFEKMTNNKKQRLQMNVNREKNEINFI